MADDIKIRVDADTATLKQLGDAIKAVKLEMLNASREAIPALRAEEVKLKQIQDELRGGTGALMKDYFEFGTVLRANALQQQGLTNFVRESRVENRLQNFLLNEGKQSAMAMASGLQVLGSGIGASAQSMNSLNATLGTGINTFQGLDFAAKGLTTALGLTGKAIAGITLGVTALVAGGIALWDYFKRSEEEARKAKIELDDYGVSVAQLSRKLGLSRGDDFAVLGALQKQVNNLREAYDKFQGTVSDKRALHIKLLNAENELYAEQQRIIKSISDDNKKDAEEDQKFWEKRLELLLKNYDEQKKVYGLSGVDKPAPQVTGVGKPSAPRTAKTPFSPEEAKQTLQEYAPLVDSLSEGFARVGASIQTEFIDKVVGSTSLFQQFVGGVVSGIIRIGEQMAASAVVSGILSLVTGGGFGTFFKSMTGFASGGVLTEPVVGVGSSGRMYSFAERGAERIAPLTSSYSGGTPQMVMVQGEFKVRGRDLVYATKQGFIMDRKRGGNF
jgi:hypothetical protein